MALTLLPLSGTLPTPAKGTIYTVPASTIAFILSCDIVNNSGGVATINLYSKLAAGTSKHLSSVDQSLAAKNRTAIGSAQAIDAAGLIEADSSVGSIEYAITLLLVT